MGEILVPASRVPVIDEVDICVIGGSCTGVFAAVRAARLGARVALVEKQNRFGGVATVGLVNIWHSIFDCDFERQIIGGLTVEVIDRLAKRGAVDDFHNRSLRERNNRLNTEELTIELDELVREAGVRSYLSTLFTRPLLKEDGSVDAVLVESKSGCGAIRARCFVDADGDADLCLRSGFATWLPEVLQPPTTCAKFSHWPADDYSLPGRLLAEHGAEFDLPVGFLWGKFTPGSEVYMAAGTRAFHLDCSDAAQLTRAEFEGRRQVRAIGDLMRKYGPAPAPVLEALPGQIGIRETRHIEAEFRVTGAELMAGKEFPDTIGYGTYPVDVHHQEKPGITLRFLDGTEVYQAPGRPGEPRRWRTGDDYARYYRIPLGCLIPRGSKNVIAAGRMLDADTAAFGALRVMVNLNQTGEAAGVAAFLSLDSGTPICRTDAAAVRRTLAAGGSILF